MECACRFAIPSGTKIVVLLCYVHINYYYFISLPFSFADREADPCQSAGWRDMREISIASYKIATMWTYMYMYKHCIVIHLTFAISTCSFYARISYYL